MIDDDDDDDDDDDKRRGEVCVLYDCMMIAW